jgi:acetyl esterase/lipase
VPTTSRVTVPTVQEPTTTTTVGATTTVPVTPTSPTTVPTEPIEEIDASITVPDGEGPFPAVVLVHGGGWVTGNPTIMAPLGRHLSEAGFLTVNTTYHLATRFSPGFPEAVEDVACAVRYASSHPDSDGTVTLIGHSAGAHIGAIVALTGDSYVSECPYEGKALPDSFVGLAGPYDVVRLGLAVSLFFGSGPTVDPESWAAGNPQALADQNPDLQALVMYGDRDGLVDDRFAIDFHEALTAAGSSSLLELVEGARHGDLLDPALVGDLIVTWLER